ncbi:MAG TPA: glycosyltransferase [Croceibacterium sp.]|nr:glycosyltransferase [Croceibacterium sp.]
MRHDAAAPLRPRIVHVAAELSPASGSTYTTVPRLCSLLESAGFEVDLLCTGDPQAPATYGLRNGFAAACFPRSRWGSALGWSPALDRELRRLAPTADIFHVHGLWRLATVTALRMARRRGVRTIVSPLGSLAPAALGVSPARKQAFWALFGGSFKSLACYHATSQVEHDQMRAFGIREPIAVIPLGVDIPGRTSWRPAPPGRREVLFMGRITPIKNLLSLVAAWQSVQSDFPDARLRIVGPDDRGFVQRLRRAIGDSGATGISVDQEVTGAARDRAYQAADVVILPSLSESFGLVVAEGLAAGRPVIATTGSPWQVLHTRGCGWWIEPTVEGLAGAIRQALDLPSASLADMGARGFQLAEREFGWAPAADKFIAAYQWVLGGGQAPAFIST